MPMRFTVLAFVLVASWPSRPAFSQPPALPVLTIRCDEPAHAISPQLYGAFFEEINHAGDGGLLGELVRNRSFEEPQSGGAVPGWSSKAGSGASSLTRVDDAPPHPEAPHALAVMIERSACVVNEGFWGMPIEKGRSYFLRVDAKKSADVEANFRVALVTADGRTCALHEFQGLADAWSSFSTELTAADGDANARLELTFTGKGRAFLDLVSLNPVDTWKGRKGGFRSDLGELFEGLAPAFVRFPGGCYVEGGDFLKDAFAWKKTLGDIAQRPGHQNATWNYWSCDGIGYHEYLQTCEDLRAEPLFVVNCGLSHKDITPLAELKPWIDDCLDAIEYANGGVETKWGALRAKNGHPASFRLKYIEIGNENGLWSGFGGTREVYTERYRPFYDAIKAKYPEIVTIADTRIDAPMELVDDHYYNSPSWFWSNLGLYDRADRKGPKIYVGEYAVTQGCGKGNLAAALAEAAFMTGLERNSDIVTMASYAPMFVREDDRKWNPDMMVFDATRSYGTPSYHVQALFAKNRPDTLLPTEIPPIETTFISKGSVGLGTWKTQAEFKDVVVEAHGKVVYRSNFAQSTEGWKPRAGDWRVVDGVLRQSNESDDIVTLLDTPALHDLTNYTLTLKARRIAGAEGFLVLFRAADDGNWCWWNVGGWGNHTHGIEKSVSGMKSSLGRGVDGHVENGRWYDVKIELTGRKIRCYLDDKLVQEAEDRALATFTAVAGRVDASGEVILKAVNGSDDALRSRIDLRGFEGVAATATSIVLTSKSLMDENSFDAQERIAPHETTLTGVSPSFEHEFPARSLTILRFRRR